MTVNGSSNRVVPSFSSTPSQAQMTPNPAVKDRANCQILSPEDQLPKKGDHEAVPSPSSDKKRKRTAASNGRIFMDNPEPPYPAATDEEKRSWQGFCEIESDPAFFNVMLKEFGVQGAKIQEVFSLDEEMLYFIPKPVYGLIFLFQYLEVDAGEQEETCPDHVWFANQISSNACATVALLNLVTNVPGLELGEKLEQFRSFTQPFPPALRGVQVAHFEFAKHIHNSFARKIDMLNLDAFHEEEYEEGQKKKKTKRQSKKSSNDDSAFHFVAYVPIQDQIWRLDGLDSNPQKFGPCSSDDWLELVAPVLSARMAECEDGQLQFSLLALVRDPLIDARETLAQNIKYLAAIEARLDATMPEWRDFGGSDDADITGPNSLYGVTTEFLQSVTILDSDMAKLKKQGDDLTTLIELRQGVALDQAALRATVASETRATEMDEEKAMDRRNDYGPFIQNWLGLIAENQELRDLVADAKK